MNSSVVEHSKEKFERLVDRFVNGKIVPFLGAGVSYNAAKKNGENSERKGDPNWGKTSTWQEQLRKEICQLVKKNSMRADNKRFEWFCKPKAFCEERRKKFDDESATEISPTQCEKLSLGQLCEIYIWLLKNNASHKNVDGQISLVRDVLKIEELANLNPCDAHYYVAYLAREGLIDEVITTNYDTCLERAYDSTWPQPIGEDKRASVIVDNEDYRKKVPRHGTPSLKIYKINGCAEKLKNDCNDQQKTCCSDENINGYTGPDQQNIQTRPEHTILLTERQLQDWRERQWARDLFRDRLRSRTIVFSGFGSDEPQVQHTVLQVIEEFQLSKSQKKNGNWWELLNSPFIAGYEDYLSFSQLQILSAYIQAHSDYCNILDEAYTKSAFTAEDLPLLKDSEEQKKLPADLFWKRVYQGVFKELLKKYCHHNSAAVAYLSGTIPGAAILFTQMLERFAPETAPFGAYPLLLTIDKNKKVTPLSRMVWHVMNSGNPPEGWYASLKDYPVTIPLILFLIFLATGRNNDQFVLDKNICLEKELFSLTFENEHYLVTTIIAGSRQVEFPQDMPYTVEGKNIVLITVPDDSEDTAKVDRIKHFQHSCSGSEDVKISLVYKIPVRLLLRKAYERSCGIDRLHEEICNLLMTPTLLIDDVRPRLSKRRRIKRLS